MVVAAGYVAGWLLYGLGLLDIGRRLHAEGAIEL